MEFNGGENARLRTLVRRIQMQAVIQLVTIVVMQSTVGSRHSCALFPENEQASTASD